MNRSHQSVLLALLLILLLGGGAVWWFGGTAAPAAAAGVTMDRSALDPSTDLGLPDSEVEAIDRTLAFPDEAPTTVAWPLEVDLTLVQRGSFETLTGVPPVGSGATASLRGNIYGPDGVGVRAIVSFSAGPNKGRVLTCDGSGSYGASDLYGGLGIVDIRTPAGRTAQREVLLREFNETPLTIGFGRPAAIYGTVIDRKGEPLQSASVIIDGREVLTDAEGGFHFPRVASGKVLAIVSKPGYARYREILPVTAGFVITREKLTFTLEAGASLALSIQEAVGDRGPALVYLIPSGGQRVNTVRGQRTFPWHLVNPIEVYPGGTTLVEDLPDGRVDVSLFHSGAVAKPATTAVRLQAGQERAQVLHIEKGQTISGTILKGGIPSSGVKVSLEAPHRTRATTDALGKRFDFLQGMVIGHIPAAHQVVHTDGAGRFVLTTSSVAPAFYLAAETTDGEWFVTRTVQPGAADLELELQPVDVERGSIEFALPGRFQGLPVQVRVQGAPRDEFELAAADTLVVDKLEQGTWRVDLTWNSQFVVKGRSVPVGREPGEVKAELPEGAIHGQNEFERKRTGR